MQMLIQNVKIGNLSISKDENGKEKVLGIYELVNDKDRVVAKQGFNGYNDIEVAFSQETSIALSNFLAGVKKDVLTTLGF